MFKMAKKGIVVVAAVALVGSLLFGKNMISYVKSGAKFTRNAVTNAVPIEIELKRAQDLLEEIIPEVHRNIQMICQEEVEIAALKADLNRSEKSFGEEEQRIKNLRNCLNTQQVSYTFAGNNYNREELKQDLSWRFDRFKEAEIVMASKQQVLNTRQNALSTAKQMLDRTRAQKQLLASKIQTLESKHRLIKASSIGTGVQIDNSKIAQTQKLIDKIKTRLEVAERVMAYESHFVQDIPVDGVKEVDLLMQIDNHFTEGESTNTEVENVETLVAAQ